MNIIIAINARVIRRKLSNGMTEIKRFWPNKQIWDHCFLNVDGLIQGERKEWNINGQLIYHQIYHQGRIIEDLLIYK